MAVENERLIGSDGKVVTIVYDDEVVGDGAQTLDELAGGDAGSGAGEGWWEITQLSDETSAFPDGLAAKHLFWDDGTLMLDDGGTGDPDKARKLIENEQADVTQFNVEISKAEVDVTTLADSVRRYRAGKTDMNGSLEGITTIGETDSEGWILNNFIQVVRQSADGTAEVREIDGSPIYMKGYISKESSPMKHEAFVWARVNILSSSLGAQGEDAQSFTSNFRIAPGDPDPTLYVRELPVAT